MILEHKFYVFTDENGNEVNLSETNNLNLLVDDKKEGVLASDVFKKLVFDEDRIEGYSLLQYYKLENGFLYDNEGKKISFENEDGSKLLLSDIKSHFFGLKDIEVSAEYANHIGLFLRTKNIELVLDGIMDEEERKWFNDFRESEKQAIKPEEKVQETMEINVTEEPKEELKPENTEKPTEDINQGLTAEPTQIVTEQPESIVESPEVKNEIPEPPKEVIAQETTKTEPAPSKSEEPKETVTESSSETTQPEPVSPKSEEPVVEENKKKEETTSDNEYIFNEQEFKETKEFYEKDGFNEYILKDYHLFFKDQLSEDEFNFIMKKSGDKYIQIDYDFKEDENKVEFYVDSLKLQFHKKTKALSEIK